MTIDSLKEKYLSILVSIIVIVLNFTWRFTAMIDMEKLVDKAIDYASISFGFLLTVLAILLQAQTGALKAIKEAGRFKDLISFNKKGVVSSLVLAIYAIVYISIGIENKGQLVFDVISLHNLLDNIFLFILMYQLTQVILFLDLFYEIINE